MPSKSPQSKSRRSRSHRYRERSRSRSPHRKRDSHEKRAEQAKDRDSRKYYDRKREESHRKRKSENPFEPSEEDQLEYGKPEDRVKQEPVSPKDKEKPNFETTGNLAADTNTFNGVVIKYNEPPEARKPRTRWRLYPFKGDEALPILQIHRQSAYLLGRDRLVADIPVHHPSISKQHAILQYRLVKYKRKDGSNGKRVRPFIIDLGSSNGTFVNNKQIDSRRYVELLEKDMIKFGYSTREYIMLHEGSRDDDEDFEEEVEASPKSPAP